MIDPQPNMVDFLADNLTYIVIVDAVAIPT